MGHERMDRPTDRPSGHSSSYFLPTFPALPLGRFLRLLPRSLAHSSYAHSPPFRFSTRWDAALRDWLAWYEVHIRRHAKFRNGERMTVTSSSSSPLAFLSDSDWNKKPDSFRSGVEHVSWFYEVNCKFPRVPRPPSAA